MTYPGFQASTPGFTDVRQSVEDDLFFQSSFVNSPVYDPLGLIDAGATDPTHTSYTNQLRVGLVMGKITSSGTWTNYSPTANDGSQIAAGILAKEAFLLDYSTGSNQQRTGIIAIAGNVKAYNGLKLIGMDQQARQQLRNAGFVFDDNSVNPVGLGYPFVGSREILAGSTATLTSADYDKLIQIGSTGAMTVTLPALAVGANLEIVNTVDQSLTISSAEGSNIVTVNNLSASNLAFTTSSQKIGARVKLTAAYVSVSGTQTLKWIATSTGVGTITCTVS